MLARETDPLLGGERLAGRYDLVDRAGAGGMGTVYRAVDRETGELVAVKLVHVAVAGDDVRFEREAAALAGVSHPAVVRYLAHGCERGRRYLVMAWLAGRTLDDQLADVGLAPAESVALGIRVASGLAAVHARGLVHRDIKPSNLMLVDGAHDQVTILDLGVARTTAAHGIVTRTGRTVGTPGYMAPEQARGERALDPRADVFSLGCVLYECLTGRTPFPGDHPTAVCTKVLLHDPPPVRAAWPEAPAALAALVDACMSKAPARRPADGHELMQRLAALPAVDPGLARRVPFRALATAPDRSAEDRASLVTVLLALPAARPPARLFEVARRLRGRADMLDDGTVLFELPVGDARHHGDAVSALAGLLGPGVIAVATGTAALAARGEVAERAAASFEAEAIASGLATRAPAVPRDAMRADEVTVALLSPPLEAILDRASYLLPAAPRDGVA